MKKLTVLLLISLCVSATILAQDIPTYSPDDINITYQEFTLDNGLRLIVHEDHKAPIVAVNMWYHVGSKDERPGKSGFAHLFEHLMFNGSEHFNEDYFQALERIGATDLNGTTNNDRTNYFQNVPVGAFDQVLWLESDRMGHLLGVIDQPRLDEQRGVVQNEKRQGENQPYGRSYGLITKATYPKGHPYSWTVIGEMEDLDAASLEDVKEWFNTYYGAANAVIAVAGDIKAEEVLKKVNTYFGAIESGPTLVKPEVNIAKREENTRQYYQDRVPEARIHQVWNTPEWGSKEDVYLNLASSVLTSGKSSRLYKKLVYEDQTAGYVYSYQYGRELGGQFNIVANVKPGQSTMEVEEAMVGELEKFLEDGPTEEELKRVKAAYFAGFIKGLERIGGFGGKSDILAQNAVYGGSPDFYKKTLQMVADATVEDVHKAAKKWLSSGKHTLVCEPFPSYSVSEVEVDRSTLPAVEETPSATFPDLQRATLDNGLEVVLAQREDVPTIVMRLMANGGYKVDPRDKAGLADMTMNFVDEGTENRTSLEINEQLQLLGASLSTYANLDQLVVSMSTLKPALGMSMDLFADVIQHPAFPDKEFERLKKEQIAGIQREKSQPVVMSQRVLPKILFGEDHPYGIPLTGSGFETTVESITKEDAIEFYHNWFKPNNATLVVVGDVTMEKLTSMLKEKLGGWEKGKVKELEVPVVSTNNTNRLYVIDRPESQQSVIIAAHLTKPYGDISEIAREAFMNVLGGEFTSRMNMNLREDKHWSYGARCIMLNTQKQRVMLTYAPVQTDKTKESVMEIKKELAEILADRKVTSEEFEKTRGNAILKMSGRWETNGAVSSSVSEIVNNELADDYYQTYGDRLKGLTLDQVHETGDAILYPEQLNWVIVGDKATILPGLEGLGFDEIVFMDADGNVLVDNATSDASGSSDAGGK